MKRGRYVRGKKIKSCASRGAQIGLALQQLAVCWPRAAAPPRGTPSQLDAVMLADAAAVADAAARLEDEGYCILHGLISPEAAAHLDVCARRAVERSSVWHGDSSYLSLEGALNHVPELAQLVEHPLCLAIAERVLGTTSFEQYNNVALKWVRPGVGAGRLHADWPQNQTPEPWPETCPMLQCFWALTAFTEANGATRCVPFSHHTRRGPMRSAYPHEVAMHAPAGSCVLFVSGLWHRQGSNTSPSEHRMAANLAYCPTWWARPPKMWPLLERELYASLSPRVQELSASSVEPEGLAATGRHSSSSSGSSAAAADGVHPHTRSLHERRGGATAGGGAGVSDSCGAVPIPRSSRL